MKKLSTLLLILCISFAAFSQSNNNFTAGDHLRKASRTYGTGAFIVTTGCIVHVIYISDPTRYSDNMKYVAPSIVILGVLVQAMGISSIERAGVKMNESTAIGLTDNGVGLVYKF